MDEGGPTQGPTILVGSIRAGKFGARDPSGSAIDDLRAWSMDQKSHTSYKKHVLTKVGHPE